MLRFDSSCKGEADAAKDTFLGLVAFCTFTFCGDDTRLAVALTEANTESERVSGACESSSERSADCTDPL